MTRRNLPDLASLITRQRFFDANRVTVVRPGLALVLYSKAPLHEVMTGAASVLEQFLEVLPTGVDLFSYEPPSEEGSPDGFSYMRSVERNAVVDRLRRGPASGDDEGYGLALYSTSDGQAQQYGYQLGAIDLGTEDCGETEVSLLRLEFPWELYESVDAERFFSFLLTVANSFPFCCGNAGYSFLYTVGFTTAAREEVQRMCHRFIGFETAYSSAQLVMRSRSPAAHWINLIDNDLVDTLGGRDILSNALKPCQVAEVGSGLAIRGALFPPVGDVNRRARDIGCLPISARALSQVRMINGDFLGLSDTETGMGWLARFDTLPCGDWDNGRG